MAGPMDLNAVVVKRQSLTEELLVLQVRPEGWELPMFKAGQYCTLGLPGDDGKLLRRVYSVASPPSMREYLELYFIIVPGGKLTPRLFKLKEGDKLWLGKKIVGLFTLDGVPQDQNIILAGTGTGLAPYVSMLREGLARDQNRKITLIHGVRFPKDLSYKEELEAFAGSNSHFTYIPLVSRAHKSQEPWSGERGHIQDVWNKGVVGSEWGIKPSPENCRVFLCGHPQMVKDMTLLLEGEGFKEHTRQNPGQIHIEKYW